VNELIRNSPGEMGKCTVPEFSWKIEEMCCSGIIPEN
jgi:hypothetical protein